MRSLTRIAGGVLLLALALAPRAAHAAVTGSIEGTVKDQATGRKLAGVTVTVTSPALQGEQTEFTDAGGHYIITELPPGEYMVRFYFSNINVERPGVVVQADKMLSVNVAIPTQKAEVKTYRITEKAPTVDVGNTQVQTQVTSELVRNTPVAGRTYQAVLAMAPGASTDDVGTSFNGATGPENNFLIDGVNTTDPAFGLLGTQLTLEFIGETELITGGYNAEYGRATGGVVNVITKSGSNQFHGDVWFYTTPFQLNANLRSRSGEAIAFRTKKKYQFDVGFDLGGPIVKDKVWFYVGFQPTFTSLTTDRFVRTRSADNLPADMMMGTYQGDLDSSVACPRGLDKSLCGTPGLLAPGYRTSLLDNRFAKHYQTDQVLYNWIAKFNFQLNPNNSLVLQYIGSPQTSDGIYGLNNSLMNTSGSLNGADTQLFGRQVENTHDASLHFVSKLADRRLQLDVMAGYHYDDLNTTPRAGKDLSMLIYYDTLSLANFEDVDPCKLQMKHGVSFNPCPVQNYRVGGFGQLSHSTVQRISASAAATYFARLGGTHAIKLGFDFEDNIYHHFRTYAGGAMYSLRGGALGISREYATMVPGMDGKIDPDAPGLALPNGLTSTVSTLNYGAYLRDSYNVGFIPGLTVNAGVRYEAQQVKDSTGATQIGIYDNWAPRVGAIYDFTHKGRSKIFASYGWYYSSIPLDMNDRSFSNEGTLNSSFAPTGCMPNMDGTVDLSKCKPATMATNSQVVGGTYSKVQPGIKGMYSEEIVAGLQYDVGLDLVLGASYIHRDLGRIIEDLSPDGGSNYFIGNPGSAPDAGQIKELQKQIQATSDPGLKQKLQQTLSLYKTINEGFPKAKRDYDALVLTATKRLSHNFLVLASYTYSRTIGNYPGLYQPSNGQLDPGISTQYDLREMMLNRNGPLDNDRPHNFKLSGSYFIPFGGNTIVLGLAFNALSGVPISVLGYNPLYQSAETYLLPRGAGGRTPTLTTFDLHASYRRQLSRLFRFEAYADVFNLFNQQEITQVDNVYTTSFTMPILNGKVADLANLKTNTGLQPLLNPNFGHATQYQQPLSMRVGVRLSF